MSYREHYAKKRASQMYFLGQSKEDVRDMLLTEGAGEQADALAAQYYDNYRVVRNHHQQQTRKSGSMYLIVGWVFIAGSLLYSLLTYLVYGNGNFIALTGLTVLGIAAVIKGMRDKQA